VVVDPQFGPLLMLGLGGVLVEVFRDVKLLALPATAEQVRAALLSLKSAPLLRGYRGRPAVALDAVVDAALRLAALAADVGDLLASVDVNPLIATESGVMVVDALIVPRGGQPAPVTRPTPPADGASPAAPDALPRWSPGTPVPAPLALLEGTVVPAWIDYNGHMTESSYLAAFGDASDALFRYIGIDEAYRAGGHSFYTVETHLNYYREALRGDPLRYTTQLLGLDPKRLHLFHTVCHGVTGALLATTEQMLLHIRTHAGGAAAAAILPEVYAALQAILEAHAGLARPREVGRVMGLGGK
jgi:carnitine 3-dehydrogenase